MNWDFVVVSIAVILVFSLLALVALRWRDAADEHREWQRLSAQQPLKPIRFDPAMVNNLPPAAQAFFRFAILPGTPLKTVAEIDMGGEFSLGDRTNPNYQPMKASQILAAPQGFIWKLERFGKMSVAGSDSAHWTRFRIFGLLPVARLGGTTDHRRSAFGRYVAEALFWTPAVFLPGLAKSYHVTWQTLDDHRAQVTLAYQNLSQTITLVVSEDGQPQEVHFMRWSDANPDKIHRLQPFGGRLKDFREVDGFRLPFDVEGGHHFGTDDGFTFFKAKVKSIRFVNV